MTIKKLCMSIATLVAASISLSQAMQQQKAATAQPASKWSVFQETPLTQWPSELYDDAFQGALYAYSFNEAVLARELKRAETITKNKICFAEETQCVILDWLYTLKQVENGLLKKPFESWAKRDIIDLAAMLTRLTGEHPLTLRTAPVRWRIKKLNKQDQALFDKIEAQANTLPPAFSKAELLFSPSELAFYRDAIFIFPNNPDAQLEKALITIQRMLTEAKSKTDIAEKRKLIIQTACTLHVEIVRIHPLKLANKRLGRLLMHILFMQNGIRPQPIIGAEEYVNILCHCLKENSPDALFKYVYDKVCKQEELLQRMSQHDGKSYTFSEMQNLFQENIADVHNTTPHYDDDAALQILQQLLTGTHVSASPQELMQRYLDHTSVKQEKDAVDTARRCFSCKKEETAQASLLRCGRCKKALYCSTACQRSDWQQKHKNECKEQK